MENRRHIKILTEQEVIGYNEINLGSTPYSVHKKYNLCKKTMLRLKKNGIMEINEVIVEKNESAIEYNNAINYYYKTKCNLTEIYDKFKIKSELFKKYLILFNLEILDYRIPMNRNVFKVIDSSDKAYWLGYLAADGGLQYNEEVSRYTLRIQLGIKDGYILENLCELLELDKSYINHNNIHLITGNKLSSLSISGKELMEDLMDKNILPNKSEKEKPYYDIREDLISHYIRGFLDGDGCIRTDLSSISFVGSKEMLLFIQKHLNEKLDLKPNVIKEKKTIYFMAYYNLKDKTKIIKYLYKGANQYLTRKHDLGIKICRLNQS